MKAVACYALLLFRDGHTETMTMTGKLPRLYRRAIIKGRTALNPEYSEIYYSQDFQLEGTGMAIYREKE